MRQTGAVTPALHWATQHSDVEMVDLLLHARANVRALNRYGVSPLELAAINGNAGIVERLVKAGADVNAVGVGGQTPLMSAAGRALFDRSKVCLPAVRTSMHGRQ